jgi:hypothetical protein
LPNKCQSIKVIWKKRKKIRACNECWWWVQCYYLYGQIKKSCLSP